MRTDLTERALATWVGQLIDLTGRNQLLYYRTLRRGTLELTDARSEPLAALLAGRSVRLRRLVGDDPELVADAVRRARTVHTRAVEWYEERGVEALLLAVGMAGWTSQTSAATPNAPVLLRPLELRAVGAAEADFDLRLTGDWQLNATLVHLLAEEFRVTVDPDALLEPALDDDGHLLPDALPRVFDELVAAAAAVPELRVAPGVVVGTFGYTKLPMVQDLERCADQLVTHEVIAAISGDQPARAALAARQVDAADLPDADRVPPDQEHLILDADHSQHQVIDAVLAGESLVVQGPPGTGKSQTIANLIAALAADGRRVLFVAEKRAAIDAVTKRLDAVGLGELVMDLHGGSTSRRELAADLARTLEGFATAPAPDQRELHERLATTRRHLDDHAAALHEPREPWGGSVWQLRERLLELPDVARTDHRFADPALQTLDADTARGVGARLEEFAALARPLLEGRSPWAGAVVHDDVEARRILEVVTQLGSVSAPAAEQQLAPVPAALGLPAVRDLAGWRELLAELEAVAATLAVVDASLFEEDLDALAAALEPAGRGAGARLGARLWRSEYRAALRTVRELAAGEAPTPVRCRELVLAAARQRDAWRQRGGSGVPRLPAELAAILAAFTVLHEHLDALHPVLDTGPLWAGPLAAVGPRARALAADQRTLFRLPRLVELGEWLGTHHQTPLLHALRTGEVRAEDLPAAFEHAWLRSILRTESARDPRLAGFDGRLQDQRVATYLADDRAHLRRTPARVRRAVAERATVVRDAHPDQDQLISAQARRKRGHLPLRELFARAPDVLLALRPCWAMSPLVVAQTLPAEPVFDVVVFDEASQVVPAEAISALLRARQVVVAGDDRQLPPTAFFDTVPDDLEDADEATTLALTAGYESVLDVLGALLGRRMLRWHYRSRDERLIAFSNQELYDGSLTTFPGPGGEAPLRHVVVPHRPEAATDTRSNPDEVARVVDLIVEHAHQRPDQTLGVIAMGQHHAERIEAALRRLAADRSDPALEALLDEDREERTFVKNLERVQGDERDAIVLSIGYGKQPDGRLLYRFGPLNLEGGERRLNVAVTRARRSMTVVSSFAGEELDPSRSSARGVQLLRGYLLAAAAGGVPPGEGGAGEAPGALVGGIAARLEAAGLAVQAGYGVSEARIDVAVADPGRPGRLVLAVETDGVGYHAAGGVRDRERLRRQVLEGLGWSYHRVWSTDWLHDPDTELARILAASEAACAAGDTAAHRRDEPAPQPPPPPPPPPPRAAVPDRGPRPDVPAGRSISAYRPEQLDAVVRWIEADTLLRTEEQLVADTMRELGFRRRGSRIVAELEAAVRRVRGGPRTG